MSLLIKSPIFFNVSALNGALCLVLGFNCIWSGPLGYVLWIGMFLLFYFSFFLSEDVSSLARLWFEFSSYIVRALYTAFR